MPESRSARWVTDGMGVRVTGTTSGSGLDGLDCEALLDFARSLQ